MTTFKSQQSVARPRTTTIATMTNLVRSRPVGRRSGGQTNLLGPSRPTVALIVASLVAAAACLLVAIPSTHLQALASTTPIDSSNHERALNYLMYKSPTKQNYSGSQAASSSQQTAGAPNGSSMTTTVAGTNSNSSLSKEHLIETLLKDVNHDHMSDRVDLKLANDIWKRMHQNALEFAQIKSNEARPAIDRFLRESGVSTKCLGAIGDTLEHIGQLDDWAIQMYNSFGELPTVGFFEGTMTSMGSYYQCVNVEPNEWIERPQYCSFKFQPIIPKRRRYHNILEPVDENLANFTRKNDMLRGFAKKAQYFYYIKMRLATCMPSKCAKSDLDLIGEQIALNTYLQYQGVECLEKEGGFNPDGAQVFAMVILFALASVSLVGTLVHLLGVRSWLEPTNKRSRSSTGVARNCGSPLSSVPIELTTGAQLKAANDKQQLARQVVSEAAALENDDLENNNNNSIAQHQVPQKGVVGMPASSSGSDVSGSSTSSVRRRRSPMVRVVDVLMHFSVIANGRKLFDTSTSAGQKANSSNNNNIARKNGATNTSATAGTGNGRHRSNSGLLEGQSNDISCVHGLRFWTISWIIMGHTFQYTEWAGFARAYQVEGNITSFLLHPLLNATFSVDTFFLISGLLTTYVTWTITRGHYWRFNKFAFLISRYLRLMPQVLIVILIFIVFPMLGEGPWWRGLVQKESDRCKQNWWVSALFLQSFYRQDQICNLVTWWLSIEMFYHFTSIIVIISLLHSARKGILAALLVGGSMTGYSFYLHYANSYPPNMMPTLVQRYEIWDDIVLKYFWTPYPHAPSYFVGLLLGYALYNRSIGQLTRRQVRFGWIAFALSYTGILFGTYYWNLNAPYSREAATAYYNFSQIFWSLATGWAILACALGEGGWLNDFLSSPVFIPLGRATYMTYLSHMLIVMSYPAKMNQLLEPSYIVFLYIFISNLVLSYALGICLTLVYESPILHLQKLLVARMASKFNDDPRMKRDKVSEDERSVRVSLYTQAHQPNQQQQHHHHLLNHHQTLDTEHSTKITTSSVCH